MPDKIGDVSFYKLTGEIAWPRTIITPLQRPAVNGIALRADAVQPVPFELSGETDYASISAALAAKEDTYTGMVGELVDIEIAGVAKTGFTVLDVKSTVPFIVEGAVGGFSGGGDVWIVQSTWTLIYSEEPDDA